MIETHKLAMFLTASLVLAATPGPGMLYVLSRTLAGGRREGILSSFGTFLGGMVHVVAAAAGLFVVLATSAVAFSVVKFAGAGYLIYLGIRMIVRARQDLHFKTLPIAEAPQPPSNSPFLQGVLTEVLNPKTALFFLAFIPQFVSRHGGHAFAGFLILGLISVILNTAGDLVAVLLAAPLQKLFTQGAGEPASASGLVMLALGAYVAVSDSR
jgi:threonine/homoserine/homoserine lactone efflux protein